MIPFVPTQRVTCIREESHWRVVADHPKQGVVYTVVDICDGIDPGGIVGPAPCVVLAEVCTAPCTRAGRTGSPVWEADCFKPVDEARIDVFRALLKKTGAWS